MAQTSFVEQFLNDKCSPIHGATRKALVACIDSVMRGASLTLTSIGRGLAGKVRTKHKIKRVDRLLGNHGLHQSYVCAYQEMTTFLLSSRVEPVLRVDWSSMEHGNEWVLLRASVAVDGRSLTLYEEAHPIEAYNTPAVNRAFLAKLKELVPSCCKPVLVSDGGFLGPWFEEVRALGWEFVGRLRGNTQLSFDGGENWKSINELYTKATQRAKSLGLARCAKSSPYQAYVYLVDGRSAQARAANPHTYNEPWLLVSSLPPNRVSARQMVKVYAKRMQIELSFRDLKDDRWSMALVNARAGNGERRQMLLLIAALATFALWLLGLVGQTFQWHRHFQANTVRKRRVLSLVFLGRELYRNPNYLIPTQLLDCAAKLLALTTVELRHCA